MPKSEKEVKVTVMKRGKTVGMIMGKKRTKEKTRYGPKKKPRKK